MSEPRHIGRAKATLTVEVTLDSPWGDDCSIGQIYKQAGEEAVGRLRNLFEKNLDRRCRIVGEPIVTAIISEQKP